MISDEELASSHPQQSPQVLVAGIPSDDSSPGVSASGSVPSDPSESDESNTPSSRDNIDETSSEDSTTAKEGSPDITPANNDPASHDAETPSDNDEPAQHIAEAIKANAAAIVAYNTIELNFNDPRYTPLNEEAAKEIVNHIESMRVAWPNRLLDITLPPATNLQDLQTITAALKESRISTLTLFAKSLPADGMTLMLSLPGSIPDLTTFTLQDADLTQTQRSDLTAQCNHYHIDLQLPHTPAPRGSTATKTKPRRRKPAKAQATCPPKPFSKVFTDKMADLDRQKHKAAQEDRDPSSFHRGLALTWTTEKADSRYHEPSVEECQALMRIVADDTLGASSTKHLYKLNFTCGALRDAQLMAIADVIRANAHVSDLNLSGNRFTMRGMLALARALQSNDHIRVLTTQHNHLLAKATPNDLDDFLKGIEDCSALQDWDLSHSTLSESALEKCIDALLLHGHITSLTLNFARLYPSKDFVDRDQIETILRTAFQKQDKRFVAKLKDIAIQVSGEHQLVVVNQLKQKALAQQTTASPAHDQPMLGALSTLAPVFPIRIRTQTLIQITAWELNQHAYNADLIAKIYRALNILGLTGQQRGDQQAATYVTDDPSHVAAIASFTTSLRQSMKQLFQTNVESMPAADPQGTLADAKARLEGLTAALADVAGRHIAGTPFATPPSPDMMQQLLTWVQQHAIYDGNIEHQHSELAITLAALIGENAHEVVKQIETNPQHTMQHAGQYVYPLHTAMPLHPMQSAYLSRISSALAFTAVQESKWSKLTPRQQKALIIGVVMLATAAIFAMFYFMAPLLFTGAVLAETTWLAAIGTAGQATLCTGATLLAMALVSGAYTTFKAHRQRQHATRKPQTPNAHAGTSTLVNTPSETDKQVAYTRIPWTNATNQTVHTFFGGHSMAQHPQVSPWRPITDNRRHTLFMPASSNLYVPEDPTMSFNAAGSAMHNEVTLQMQPIVLEEQAGGDYTDDHEPAVTNPSI